MDTYFLRCVNGHYYEANKYDVCPYCSAETDYTQYRIDPEDDQEVTVKSGGILDEEEDSGQRYEPAAPRNEKKERYADYRSSHREFGRRPQMEATVRMTEAGFDDGRIDPVEIALSVPMDTPHQEYMNRGRSGKEYGTVKRDEEQTFAGGYSSKSSAADAGRPKTTFFPEPAGWLICVDGPDFGKSYPLREGKNNIGRSDEMDVVLKNDPYVSRKNHAWIEYVEAERKFIVYTGETKKMIYLNDDLVLTPLEMRKNDILILEDTSLMLIPCCDENFSWKSAKREGYSGL